LVTEIHYTWREPEMDFILRLDGEQRAPSESEDVFEIISHTILHGLILRNLNMMRSIPSHIRSFLLASVKARRMVKALRIDP